MDFRVLGPLEASDEGRSLSLGPRRQRAVLARLLLDAGRTVAVERLLDDVWGDDLPDTAVKMVQIYVSGLRKSLGAGRLVTQSPGYRLDLAPGDELDLHRFERLAAAGRSALARGDPSEAAARLAEALALWRGPALAEFAPEPFARGEADRLDELRLAALEDRVDADLALGRTPALVAELEALTARHPLRERPREQLMLALHRSGRQGEALAAYHAFRALLDEQLGIGPSPRLRALEQAILTHDPALDDRGRAAPAPAAASAPPGREPELAALRAARDAASGGRRGLVVVSGEPGIGKRTVVEALLDGADDALVIRGQCAEQQDGGEAYLPILDGLGRAAADPAVAATIAARAPTWLAHLPAVAADAPPERGATGERMLREMLETLEALAAERPVLLVVEHLHWADGATRDLLRALMRRRHPARLLVVATGAPGDPLVADLVLRGAGRELVLAPLGADAAATAFGLDPDRAAEVVRRGGGNPLFMRHLVDHLRETGTLEGVPATLRAAWHARLSALPPDELERLQAAAVEGLRFTAAGVAAGLDRPVEAVPTGPLVVARGSADWPDGTHTGEYAFAHDLVRDVLLDTIPADRRAELHRRIGERLEEAFGAAPEHAHAIAAHHLAGHQPAPAIRFLRVAAARALSRRAHAEAIADLRQALAAAAELPLGPGRQRVEIELLSDLGQASVALEGWSSPHAADALERARATAEALGDREPLASVLLALATLYEVRGQPQTALVTIGSGDGADEGTQGAELLACALFHQGAFTRALEHADRGSAEFERASDQGHYTTFPATFGDNAGVSCHDWAALSLWFLGRAGESLDRAGRALDLTAAPDRAYSAATARAQLALLYACRAEPEETLRWAQATVDAARERGYSYRVAMGRVLRGWAWAAAGRPDGLDELACGLRASRATGAHLEDPLYLGLLADAHLRSGDAAAGLAAVGEALETAARERAHYYDAELQRLRGELLRASGREPAEVEAVLREALATARAQDARSIELRVALSLARLLGAEGRVAEARALVAVAHEPLADEDTPDVREASELLAGSGRRASAGFTRRRVTILAWEIGWPDELAGQLEPERLARVVADFHAAVRELATEQGGHVATEDESGGLVYFGYPQVLEDGPLHAVRAARRLVTIAPVLDGVAVRACVGIDSGPAVVGPVGRAALAMGQTPRGAWRLAVAAAPGEIHVSEPARAACAGWFGFVPAGDGHRVTGPTAARSPLEARGELSPLVGRERELGLLAGRWEQASRGLGQALLLTGEAGVGKSRIVRELAAGLAPEAATVLEFACSDARTASALHPVAAHFRRRWDGGSLDGLLAEAGIPPDGAPVLAALLGVAGAARLDPAALRRRTSELVIGSVLAQADRGPVLAVFEDLHWADPSTLELLEELLDAIPESRVLLVATARPSRLPPWAPRSHVSHLALAPCTPTEAAELVRHVAALPPDVAAQVVVRGDGIPLYLEELARTAAAGGAAAGGLPATLADSLVARLDALGPAARAVAEVGAVIGREFSRELLGAVAGLEPADVDAGLARLTDAEVLRRRSRGGPAAYAFRHALLREAAGAALPDRSRRELHGRIAAALERDSLDLVRREPETLARHLEGAGEPGRAVPHRLQAGRIALSRSAAPEAADQLARAIADVGALPEGEGRDSDELDLHILLGNALISARGYASAEVATCYQRARVLCERLGDEDRLLPVLYGLWVNQFVRARHQRVLELGHELLALAEGRDAGVTIVALRAVGWPLVCMGRFAEARAYLDRVPALHRPDDQAPLRLLYGQDPAASGLATGSWALWGCGEPEAAEARAAEAIAAARTLDHPLSLVYALGVAALLGALQGDAAAARSRATEAIAVAEQYRLPLWVAWSRYALGWAELAEGHCAAATATLTGALALARETGAVLYEPFALTTLAAAESRIGRHEDALRHLDEAETAALRGSELFWQRETVRAYDALAVRIP